MSGKLRQTLVLAVCAGSVFLVMMDATGVNLALPAIGRSLHLPVSGLQWTAGAYSLAAATFVITAGAAGDSIGRRAIFQVGAGLFLIGSLLCVTATSQAWLVAARVVQGCGGAALSPMALAILTSAFTEPARRSRAIGIWSGAAGLGVAAGPVLGGALLARWGWHAIFWANMPAVIAAIVIAGLVVPDFRARRPRRSDLPGQLLVTIVLSSLTYSVIEGPAFGWRSPQIIAGFGICFVAAAMLGMREPRIAQPLIEFSVFRIRRFSAASLITLIASGLAGGFNFLSTLYLQDVRGLPPLHAGILLAPSAAGALAAPVMGGRTAVRLGPRVPLVASGAALTLSFAGLSTVSRLSSMWYVIAMYALFGLAFGLLNTAVTTVAMSGLPQAQAGVAGGISSTCRQLGTVLGVSVIGSVFAARLHGTVSSGFASASFAAWAVMMACGFVVIIAAFATAARSRKAHIAPDGPPGRSLIYRGRHQVSRRSGMLRLPSVGQEFAGYKLLAVLGRGGTSIAYRAVSPRLGNVVTVRLLLPEFAADEVFRARFFEESRIAATITHPNLIPIHDLGSSDGLAYIALRYVSGASLRQTLAKTGRLRPQTAVFLLSQVARALDAAHREGLIHRDVKPANVLIEHAGDADPGHVYLAGFGLTQVVTAGTGFTSPGQFLGSVDYIAPEQIWGSPALGLADQYSLGCVLYECLTGRVPFARDTQTAKILAHAGEWPAPATTLCADLPPGLDPVFSRALAKEPDDRYGSCCEFVAAASAAIGGAPPVRLGRGVTCPHVPAPPHPQRPAGGSRGSGDRYRDLVGDLAGGTGHLDGGGGAGHH